MANYREILRLHSLGTSQRGIASEVQSSRDTVADIIKAANAAEITWPLDVDIKPFRCDTISADRRQRTIR